jgi:hypothetical protein
MLLLDDLGQFRHLLEVFLLGLFVFLGLRGPGRRVGWHWNGNRGHRILLRSNMEKALFFNLFLPPYKFTVYKGPL